MPRPKTSTTLALEKISAKSEIGIKHLRELHRQGMPTSSTQAAQNWLANRPDQSPAASSVEALRQERIKLTRAHVQKAELELAIRRNEFIAREEVVRHFASAGQGVRALLLALERAVPAAVHGKSLPESQSIVRAQLVEVMTRLQDTTSEFWKGHPESED